MERDRLAAQERKLEFLRAAIKDGAHERIPVDLGNIGAIYEGTAITYEQLGKMCGSPKPWSKQYVKQKRDQFLKSVHKNCSLAIQEQYKLAEILARKYIPDEIMVKRFSIADFTQLKKKIDQEEDCEKLQNILDEQSVGTIRVYSNPKRWQPSIFLFLGTLLHQAGYHFSSRDLGQFEKTLRNAGIPLRKVETGLVTRKREREYPQTYWSVLAKSKEAILKAVENDSKLESLKENPVKLISGVYEGKSPSTYEIRDSDKYERFWGYVYDIIGLIGGWKGISDFLAGCKVPVFESRGVYSFPSEKKPELKAFLEEKYRKTH